METAIQKAIKEGYGDGKLEYVESVKHWCKDAPSVLSGEDHGGYILITNEAMLLDPLFWQALIKDIGQGKGVKHTYRRRTKKGSKKYMTIKRQWRGGQRSWKYQWHLFIDHLISGKDADSFFKGLLK